VTIERIDMRVDLEQVAARLTRKQRLALWLWLCGYTQADIGDALGVGQPAIAMRIKRARETIQEGQT